MEGERGGGRGAGWGDSGRDRGAGWGEAERGAKRWGETEGDSEHVLTSEALIACIPQLAMQVLGAEYSRIVWSSRSTME
jgi:hypothetical protein